MPILATAVLIRLPNYIFTRDSVAPATAFGLGPAGARITLWFCHMRTKIAYFRSYGCWHKSRKHRRPKTPSLDRAIKKAKAEGMDVTFAPDGAVTFKKSTDNISNSRDSELDQWLAKQHAH